VTRKSRTHLTAKSLIGILAFLLSSLAYSAPLLAQDSAEAGTAEEQEAPTATDAVETTAAPAASGGVRPFNAYERFSYESAVANQLTGLIGRYLNSSRFNISVEIDGRMVLPAGGTSTATTGGGARPARVRGKQSDPMGEDKVLEMLPALPFFSSRLRAPATVEAEEVADGDEAEAAAPQTTRTSTTNPGGPAIDRIRVNFMVDSVVDDRTINFYKNLISTALRMDAGRGDGVTVTRASFPAVAGGDSPTANNSINAQLVQDPGQAQALTGAIDKAGSDLALLLGLGLAVLGVLIFIGLIWRGRKADKAAAAQAPAAAAGGGGGMRAADGMPMEMNMGGGKMQMQTEMVMRQDNQQADLNASDPILSWLINDKEALAFAFERMVRDQGNKGITKMVMLLFPYGHDFYDMLSELLEPETISQVDIIWNGWNPDAFDPVGRQRAQDELVLAMKNQRQFGNFPFIIHLKDEEILDLLNEEEPLTCAMVLDGLAPYRKSNIMGMLGITKSAEILAVYPELSQVRFNRYAELSTRLFTKLKTMREGGARNLKAYESVLNTIEQQAMAQQAEMVENLRNTNRDMYEYVRERILLWEDVVKQPEETLRDAVATFDSEGMAALLYGDTELQEKILPLRAPREQTLIRDLIAQSSFSGDRIEQERRRLLVEVRKQANNSPEVAKIA